MFALESIVTRVRHFRLRDIFRLSCFLAFDERQFSVFLFAVFVSFCLFQSLSLGRLYSPELVTSLLGPSIVQCRVVDLGQRGIGVSLAPLNLLAVPFAIPAELEAGLLCSLVLQRINAQLV
jgi:hypothetical protein